MPLLFMALSNCGQVKILSPSDDAMVIGNRLKIIVESDKRPDIQVRLDDENYNIEWNRDEYKRWMATLIIPRKDAHHRLALNKKGGDFNNNISTSIELGDEILKRYLKHYNADSLKWNWGEGVLLFALAKFADKSQKKDKYIDYLKQYHGRYVKQCEMPQINYADRCTPALSGYMLAKDFNIDIAMPNVKRVVHYIKNEKRNSLGSINHLGNGTIQSIFFPPSIWMDSLMMWDILAVKYGIGLKDQELKDFGLKQPIIFASKLKDAEKKLVYHAWNVRGDKLLPVNNTYWIRANAWMLVTLIEILSEIDAKDKYYITLKNLFIELTGGALACRLSSGYWDTVMGYPGFAYEETSGSLLIAYSFARGYRLGLLEKKYLDSAVETFQAVTARMEKEKDGYSIGGISIGTNPSGKCGYRMVPRGKDISYGVGAFILLAQELSDLKF